MLRAALAGVLTTSLLLAMLAPRVAVGQESTPSEAAALQAYRQGAFSQAVELYTRALNETEDSKHKARLHVLIGWTLFALSREDEVGTHLRAALIEDPDLVLLPDYYTQEFLSLFDSARVDLRSSQSQLLDAPSPDLEATLSSIDERIAGGTDLEGALADVQRLLVGHPADERLLPRQNRLMELLGLDPSAMPLPEDSDLADPAEGIGTSSPMARVTTTDLILRANRMLDEGDAETALEILREAVGRLPSNVPALELMAEAAQRASRWQEAEFALKSALGLQPDNISLRLRLGEVAVALGDASAARDQFHLLTERFPHSDRSWAALGLLDARLGKREQALIELAKALEENPLLPDVQLAYGELLLVQGRPAEALDAFSLAANLLRDDPQLDARRGQALLRLGRGQEAAPLLRAATEKGYEPADVRRAFIRVLIDEGLFAEADRELAELGEDSSTDTSILRALLLIHEGENAAAQTVLEGLVETRSGDPEVLNLMGVAQHRQASYQAAIAYLSRALELRPDDEIIRTNLDRARAARDAEILAAGARPLTRMSPSS